MNILHAIYPFICGWTLGCFYLLGLVNRAALRICVKILVLVSVFSSLGHRLRSGTAYGIPIFNFGGMDGDFEIALLNEEASYVHRWRSLLWAMRRGRSSCASFIPCKVSQVVLSWSE